MKNETSFKEGNGWRFSKDCQPKRRMTSKQMLKAIDDVLNMTFDELGSLRSNPEAPYFLRQSARYIQDGNLMYVAEVRREYANSLGNDIRRK